MAKKTYPAWHYYLAAGIALLFGIGLLSLGDLVYGVVFVVAGIVLAIVGLTKRTKDAPPQ